MSSYVKWYSVEASQVTCGKLLCKGGFGAIHLAKYKDKDVVLKKLLPGMLDASTNRTLDEELIRLCMARHENVVKVYGFIAEPSDKAIVLEYMKHGSLASFLRDLPDHPPFSITARMVLQVTSAMEYLHHMLRPPLLHRDIKAQNILVNEEFNVKLTDFGLSESRALTETITLKLHLRDANKEDGGTITHVPPEKLADARVVPTVTFDVYSYGITLWEILSRQSVSSYLNDVPNLRDEIIKGYRPSVTSIRPDCPAKLKGIMECCWAAGIGERPRFNAIRPDVEKLQQVVTESDHKLLQRMAELKELKDTSLHEYLHGGNEQDVEALLQDPEYLKDYSPNSRGKHGWTPLHVAAEVNKPREITLLQTHGANINAQTNSLDQTPLHVAANHGNLECVELLLQMNADITLVDVKGCTALHLAQTNHNSCVKPLQEALSTVHHGQNGKSVQVSIKYGPEYSDGRDTVDDTRIKQPIQDSHMAQPEVRSPSDAKWDQGPNSRLSATTSKRLKTGDFEVDTASIATAVSGSEMAAADSESEQHLDGTDASRVLSEDIKTLVGSTEFVIAAKGGEMGTASVAATVTEIDDTDALRVLNENNQTLTKSLDGRRTMMVLSGNLQKYVHQKLPMIGQDEDLVIPVEIWSQGKAAERAYLDALSAGEPQLRAETVAIVGERGAGKTSIALTLQDGKARITQAQLNQDHGPLRAQLRNGRQVLVYDLGSHSEHESDLPLFLPLQGIIIIAYDMSKPVQQQLKAVKKWMNIVHARAPEAKLIVIGTKSDCVPSDMIETNQRQVHSCIENNFQGAIDEYQDNIDRIERESSEDKHQFLLNSLNALAAKRWHLKSLSCTGSTSVEELLEVLPRLMEPPTVLPHSWNRAMMKFQLQPVLTITEKEIFFKSCGLSDNVSLVVFQYLVTCQCVVCFEDIIFTQLGKLAELCKNVLSLEETSDTKGATNTRGYVSTVDVDKLLKTFTPNVVAAKNLLLHLGVLCNPKGATQLKVQRQLLVPALLGDTASAIKVEQDVVSVHAQFVFSGLILPLLLYEQPLAVLQKLDLSKASSKWWRSGFAFRVNEVSIMCKWLKHDQDYALDISAASRNIVNLWRELLPLLAGVRALSTVWKGAGYECHIFCPSCELRGRLGREVHRFDCDLEPTRATTSSQYCQRCKIDVPALLLGVRSEAQVLSQEDNERVHTFLKEQAGGSTVPTSKSVVERLASGDSLSPTKQPANMEANVVEALSSPVRMSLWQQKLRTNRKTLVERMSDVDIVINSLYSQGALTLYEKEKAEAHIVRYQKVIALLDTLQIKEDACVSLFVQVLNESEQGHLAALFDS